MKNTIVYILFSAICLNCTAQIKTENNKEVIKEALEEITPAIEYFLSDCIVNKDCNECITDLVSKAKNEYQQYLIAGVLYNIDAEASYNLHKAAYIKRPTELNFNLEYAIENHRIGDYETAIKHYEIYKQANDADYRIDVWLSECYLNMNNYTKAIEHWKLANHPKNHTGIDKAIHIIRGETDGIKKRSDLIAKIKSKDSKSAYELIFLDMNWKLDWWNTNIQEYFLEKDIATIKNVFGANSTEYVQLAAYTEIKHLSQKKSSSGAIKTVFINAKLVVDNNKIPTNGNVASDLLRIALINKLVDEKEFFEKRGQEIVALADQYKDIELLNIYAYLEAVVTGHVSEETDKKGWNEYKSEKFAISYFIGLAAKNTYDNPDLAKAITDFPNSSKIHWVKLNCAVIEKKDIKPDLIEVLKKEFKTLGYDRTYYSYNLKNYFYLLEKEL